MKFMKLVEESIVFPHQLRRGDKVEYNLVPGFWNKVDVKSVKNEGDRTLVTDDSDVIWTLSNEMPVHLL